jgi:hypothetical protein
MYSSKYHKNVNRDKGQEEECSMCTIIQKYMKTYLNS